MRRRSGGAIRRPAARGSFRFSAHDLFDTQRAPVLMSGQIPLETLDFSTALLARAAASSTRPLARPTDPGTKQRALRIVKSCDVRFGAP